MRTLNCNTQNLYYALYSGETPVYALDSEGNILIQIIDGQEIKVVESYVSGYSTPVAFKANISFNSGETRLAEYGLDIGDYDAIIQANKGKLPFNEQTLIWHKSTPAYDKQGNIDPTTADYRVIAIRTSLNEERFILKKRVDKNEADTPSA